MVKFTSPPKKKATDYKFIHFDQLNTEYVRSNSKPIIYMIDGSFLKNLTENRLIEENYILSINILTS